MCCAYYKLLEVAESRSGLGLASKALIGDPSEVLRPTPYASAKLSASFPGTHEHGCIYLPFRKKTATQAAKSRQHFVLWIPVGSASCTGAGTGMRAA